MAEAPLRVDIPTGDADRPAMGRVGLIAAVGFVVGIAWPKLTGTHITPNPPNDAPGAAAAAASASAAALEAHPASSATGAAPRPAASNAPPAPVEPSGPAITVGEGAIVRCRDAKGEVKGDCGALLFDPLAVPRLEGLAKCPAATGATGKLGVVFDVDFKRKAVHVHRGKGGALPRATAAALMKCVEASFANVSLDETPHDHQRYTLSYAVSLGAAAAPAEAAEPGAKPAGTTTNETPESGTRTVKWDAVRVRAAPKSDDVVGRVLRDAKVTVVGRQNDWIHIQFGPSAKDGWVYRTAIGM